jgi:probable rRNA maturation factor
MRVELRNLQAVPPPAAVLSAAARHALALAGASLDCLSLALVDRERMARLNRQFLGRSEPTDVIAFPAEETEEGRCGEAIVCVPVAEEQAQERGHSLARELAILVAHGTLHTVGYEDGTEAEREVMSRLQEQAADLALADAE